MRHKSIEEIYVHRIETAIKSIERGNKKPHEIEIQNSINGLRKINDGLLEDLEKKLAITINAYERKKIENSYKKVW